ncbi:CCA tRNA nucleotidyltransferase, mitochondrial [Linnemannia zychae]|nr:CCA tRNA nucleotidyltransferase, mitochondrial [Linnemannia zychae]
MVEATHVSHGIPTINPPKRRASSDLLPIDQEHASKQRIVSINNGVDVCHSRSISTSSASHFQETSTNEFQEAMMLSAPSSPRLRPHQNQAWYGTIRLTAQEAKICKILNQVAQNYEAKVGKKVELRIAGGWVRDKLLRLSCHDLDIGLDTMMGYDFAVLVNEYMESIGKPKRTISKIATNPERSKYLETTTMVVNGMPLDFVNLRSESYDDNTRDPSKIVFGTPKEDAELRDITINALFYNIHTNKIEDWTRMGLQDLRNKIIRTPLEALKTFSQDPLRALRCIRFASRFQFTIAEETKNAILNPQIKHALKTKISRERIGAELDKIIDGGTGWSDAIQFIEMLNLYDVVFAPPEVNTLAKGTTAVHGTIHDINDASKLIWIMEWILNISPSLIDRHKGGTVYQVKRSIGHKSLLKQTRDTSMTSHLYPVVTSQPLPDIPHIPLMNENSPERLAVRNIILAAMLYPYRDMKATVNNKVIPAGPWILRYRLKGKNVDIDFVGKLIENIKAVRETVDSMTTSVPEDEEVLRKERADMGMLIREFGYMTAVGKKWPSAILLGLGIELIDKFEYLKQGILDIEAKAIISKYNSFLSKTESYQIGYSFAWKYMVDGKEISKILGVKPGPSVQGYLGTIMRWQLEHPHSSKEECVAWIQEHPELFR